MSTIQKRIMPVYSSAYYGITEQKKTELDTLTIEVLDAQFEVEQCQAIVQSLNDKLAKFEGFLADADANRKFTLNNWNLLKQLLQSTIDLKKNSVLVLTEMGLAKNKTTSLSSEINIVVNKLIYTVEVINKLANEIVRKKAINPLISDDLISMLGTAGKDANNAVALTLVALKSSFAAQATSMEAHSASKLENSQAQEFYELLTTGDEKAAGDEPLHNDAKMLTGTSLRDLIYQAYDNAKTSYEQAMAAYTIVTVQVNNAQAQLDKANIKLQSLQLGLTAGNAAALAS